MSNFLDKTGLSYFWNKIKAYVNNNTLPKQTGTAGQLLGFVSDNVVGAVDPSPAGTASVLYTTIQENTGGSYTSSIPYATLWSAYNSGYAVFARLGTIVLPLVLADSSRLTFSFSSRNDIAMTFIIAIINSNNSVEVNQYNTGLSGSASDVVLDPIEGFNASGKPVTDLQTATETLVTWFTSFALVMNSADAIMVEYLGSEVTLNLAVTSMRSSIELLENRYTIKLQTAEPTTVPDGQIIGVYE